nr:retrovirus-related Pol polyprotein from transposon TNT 1-94 [Tanacetum cinerariifolium]
MKGIKREFSIARTPQQNEVVERKNKTIIEAARTMLADLLLPTTFWAEAVSTACYVHNRVLVTKPHNKTPYKLLIGRSLNLDFMKPFGCPVTILNTLDHLGKFERKADEGFLVGYSVNSKAFRVFNSRTRRVKENLHIKSLENKPNVAGRGIEINANAVKARQEKASDHEYILLPFMPSSTQSSDDKDAGKVPYKGDEGVSKGSGIDDQEKTNSSTQDVDTVESSINTASININTGSLNINIVSSNDPSMPSFKETVIFNDVYGDREVGVEADTNLELSTVVSHIPTTRVHKDHPKEQIIGDLNLTAQTRRMLNFSEENPMDRSNQDIFSLCIIYGVHCVPDGCKEYLSVWHNRRGEVYVCQPPSFEDLHFPNMVYKVEKALYGLIKLPELYKCMFIIFGSTNKSLCDVFEQKMHKRFQMSFMGELTFFLGLQVKQKDDGIFVSQDKYVADILKKFDFTTMKTASTPMEPNKTLIKDAEAKDVDVHLYRLMIRSLMYLTASRPDIMFVVCACFWATAKSKTVNDVKQIHAKADGKTVVISKSSVRSDCHFNDEDG